MSLATNCGSAVNVPGGSLPVTDTAYTPGLKLPVRQQWNTNMYTHFMTDNIGNDLGLGRFQPHLNEIWPLLTSYCAKPTQNYRLTLIVYFSSFQPKPAAVLSKHPRTNSLRRTFPGPGAVRDPTTAIITINTKFICQVVQSNSNMITQRAQVRCNILTNMLSICVWVSFIQACILTYPLPFSYPTVLWAHHGYYTVDITDSVANSEKTIWPAW